MRTSKDIARAHENALLLNAWAGLFVSCDQRFFDPIILPGGKPLITLRDAALYNTKLPKAEHFAEEWQAAMQALLLVAEHDGPTMFARIGVMRALNRHVERVRSVTQRYSLGTAEAGAGSIIRRCGTGFNTGTMDTVGQLLIGALERDSWPCLAF
jgi:hypothetical protein